MDSKAEIISRRTNLQAELSKTRQMQAEAQRRVADLSALEQRIIGALTVLDELLTAVSNVEMEPSNGGALVSATN